SFYAFLDSETGGQFRETGFSYRSPFRIAFATSDYVFGGCRFVRATAGQAAIAMQVGVACVHLGNDVSGSDRPGVAVVTNGPPGAETAAARLRTIFGTVSIDEADYVIALGGDGLMLHTLHRAMPRGTPVYGMNFGS